MLNIYDGELSRLRSSRRTSRVLELQEDMALTLDASVSWESLSAKAEFQVLSLQTRHKGDLPGEARAIMSALKKTRNGHLVVQLIERICEERYLLHACHSDASGILYYALRSILASSLQAVDKIEMSKEQPKHESLNDLVLLSCRTTMGVLLDQSVSEEGEEVFAASIDRAVCYFGKCWEHYVVLCAKAYATVKGGNSKLNSVCIHLLSLLRICLLHEEVARVIFADCSPKKCDGASPAIQALCWMLEDMRKSKSDLESMTTHIGQLLVVHAGREMQQSEAGADSRVDAAALECALTIRFDDTQLADWKASLKAVESFIDKSGEKMKKSRASNEMKLSLSVDSR